MKKTFSLQIEGKEKSRVVQAIKVEISRYVKRERKKPLKEDVDFWDFDCRIGSDSATANPVHISGVPGEIDTVVGSGADKVYVEILARPGHRTKKTVPDQEQ